MKQISKHCSDWVINLFHCLKSFRKPFRPLEIGLKVLRSTVEVYRSPIESIVNHTMRRNDIAICDWRDARRTDKNKVKIVECEMSETMKAQAITTAIIAFQEFNTYEKISANISGVFDQMHGEYWQCVIGPHGFNARFNYISGTYLAFSFGDAQVVMFQIMKQVWLTLSDHS